MRRKRSAARRQTEPDPRRRYVAIAPALDVPRDVPHRAIRFRWQFVVARKRRSVGGSPSFSTVSVSSQSFTHTGGGMRHDSFRSTPRSAFRRIKRTESWTCS